VFLALVTLPGMVLPRSQGWVATCQRVLRLPQRNFAHSSSVSSSLASRGSSGVSADSRLSTVGLRLGVASSREGRMRKGEAVVEVGVACIVSGLVGVSALG